MASAGSQWERDDEPASEVQDERPSLEELTLIALVEEHMVSVRLRNSVVLADRDGRLPFETLGQYISCGTQAPLVMMREVRNFGRTTAYELDALIRAVFISATGAPPPPPAIPAESLARTDVLDLFSDELLADVVRDELLSVRLGHALAQPKLATLRFIDVLEQFPSIVTTMLRMPNCGRKSTTEFRNFCERHVAARLRQAGYVDSAPLVGWMLGGPAPANVAALEPACSLNEGTTERETLTALPDPFAPPEHETLAERLEWLLSDLDPRVQMILRRRNGIGRSSCETLEEIGGDLSVTRERIRQIEAKWIKRLRIRVRRAPIATLLRAAGEAAWPSLAGGEDLLRRRDVPERRRRLDPYVRLALDLQDMILETWLDDVAQPFAHGWLGPDLEGEDVRLAGEQLEAADDAPLPQALCTLTDGDNVAAARCAAVLVRGRPVLHDYLMPLRVGTRLTRLVRLHILLANAGSMPLERLIEQYRSLFEDDPCCERDAEIVMDAAPHLFLETEEANWSAIGRAGVPSPSPAPAVVPIKVRTEEAGTIAYALQSTLRSRGPTRLVDLLDDAVEILPDGRSINSIGPVLLTRRELFVRALPGVYAVPEQIGLYQTNLPEQWPILFNDTQARLYAYARYAGEPRRIFPLWSASMEYALCRWARHSGGEGIYASLLAIADIDAWPVDEDGRREWHHRQEKEERFVLGNALRHGAAYELPELDRVFAACRYAATTGQFNWIAGNRLTGRKIDSHGGAGLVALLLRMGALKEMRTDGFRWQRPHHATHRAEELCQKLDQAFSRLGSGASWASSIGQDLSVLALNAAEDDDWVDDIAFSSMFVRTARPAVTNIEDDDDPLAQILAAQRRARDVERREATLDWLLEE